MGRLRHTLAQGHIVRQRWRHISWLPTSALGTRIFCILSKNDKTSLLSVFLKILNSWNLQNWTELCRLEISIWEAGPNWCTFTLVIIAFDAATMSSVFLDALAGCLKSRSHKKRQNTAFNCSAKSSALLQLLCISKLPQYVNHWIAEQQHKGHLGIRVSSLIYLAG